MRSSGPPALILYLICQTYRKAKKNKKQKQKIYGMLQFYMLQQNKKKLTEPDNVLFFHNSHSP